MRFYTHNFDINLNRIRIRISKDYYFKDLKLKELITFTFPKRFFFQMEDQKRPQKMEVLERFAKGGSSKKITNWFKRS